MRVTGSDKIRADLAKMRALPRALSQRWDDITQPELERQLHQRAGRVRTKTGGASRLGHALLRSSSVDKNWRWRRTERGGELVLSRWAARAAAHMLTYTSADLTRLKRELRRRAWRR